MSSREGPMQVPPEPRLFHTLAMQDISTALATPEALDDYMPGVLEEKSLFSMTHLWDASTWARHKSRHRWAHMLVAWPHSSILRAIRLPLGVILLVTLAVLQINALLAEAGRPRLTLPLAPLSLQASSLGLLLVFRNNQTHERLKEALRPIWKSDDDVGFPARLAAGSLAGAANVTLAYPLDVVRTNIASSSKRAAGAERWAGIAETFRLLYRTHGLRGFARGLPATQLCQGANIGLHFGIYETLNTNPYYRSAFERAMPRSWRTIDDDGRPRTSFAYSMVCGQCAGLVASTLVQPLDLVRRRQQLLGSGEGRVSFWRVAADLVRIGGVKELYRGLAPELCKVCLFPASGLNFYVYELVRQEVFGDRSGRR